MLPISGVRLPTEGKLSYLYERTPAHKHRGIDLPARRGTPVRSVAFGKVVQASNKWARGFGGYGRHVVVTDGKHWFLYAHLDRALVRPGDIVSEGQQIGTVGTTRFTSEAANDNFRESGAHLHFEVAPRRYPMGPEDERLDPVAFLSTYRQTGKPQRVRRADVALIGPTMMAAGAGVMGRNPLLGWVVWGSGLATILYNLHNMETEEDRRSAARDQGGASS